MHAYYFNGAGYKGSKFTIYWPILSKPRLASPINLTFLNAGINVLKVFIIFKIRLMDCLSHTKKVLSSANPVTLISISPILNPLRALSFLI